MKLNHFSNIKKILPIFLLSYGIIGYDATQYTNGRKYTQNVLFTL